MSKLLSSVLRHGFLFDVEDDKGGNKKPDDASGKKSFTQEELDALMGDRARRASEAATKKLLEDLGVKDPEELKTRLQKAKDAEDAQLGELDKARKAVLSEKDRADKAEQEKTDALQRANESLLRSAVTTEALKQNVDEAEIKSLWLVLKADSTLLAKIKAKPDDPAEFDGLTDAITEMVKAHPRWLKTTTQVDINARNRGNGGAGAAQDELVKRKRASDSAYSNL